MFFEHVCDIENLLKIIPILMYICKKIIVCENLAFFLKKCLHTGSQSGFNIIIIYV